MTPNELLSKLREAKVIEVKVGNITFHGVCPSYSALLKIISTKGEDISDALIAARTVTGWTGMTEADIHPDGDPEVEIKFDAELFREVILDRSDWWTEISQAVTRSVISRQVKRDEEVKN